MTPLAHAVRLASFILLYIAGDWLGEHLLLGPDQITLIWLPAGVSFAALALYGRKYWVFIPLAEALSQFGEPLGFVAVTMVANTVAALAASRFLHYLADVDTDRFVTRSGAVFMAAALVLAGVSAVIGVIGLTFAGYLPSEAIESAFLKWLVANFFGVLLISPAVLLLAQVRRVSRSNDHADWPNRWEHGLWLIALCGAMLILARADRATSAYVLGLTSLPLGLLIWAALRFQPWVTALASFCVGLLLTILAGRGLSGFTRPETMTDAVILLTFLSMIVVVPMFLTGAATQNRLAVRRLLKQARTDELTDLLNRSGFEAAVRARISAHGGEAFGLLYLDLDNFKLINDNAGHAEGDALVRSLTGLLQAELPSNSILSRLGGDEFALFVDNSDLTTAVSVAQSVRESIAAFRFPSGGHIFSTAASIGIVPFVAGESDYSHLLAQADAACFTAKELGGNRVQLSSGGEAAVAEQTSAMRWAVRLRNAIDNDHFQVYCQSIVPLHDNETRGRHFEVLIRLLDPESGKILMPGQFVPAAERFRMGPQLDRHVLDRSLRWLEQQPAWLADVSMCSINLCAASVDDEGFVSYLHQRLASSCVPANKICFEITETSAVRDLGEAQRFIDGVRKLGCRLALDDFGTGFCSFAYLDSLDVDYFKIDGSFVRKIIDSELSLSIVRAIADIARSINKQTVAEFVETPALRERLAELGVDYAQGYAMDAPMPIEKYFAHLPRE